MTSGIAELLVLELGVIAAAMIALWLVSLAVRDASIVDMFWGLGFVVIAWTAAVATDTHTARKTALVALTTVWGVRLSAHLVWRNLRKPEDYRYRAMREHHGARFPLVSLFTVFVFQGIVMCVVSLPVQAGQLSGSPGFGVLQIVGVGLWTVGIAFESIGDLQLARFKADPANEGKVMERGLWRYTRHPNYFGDFMVWWGLFAVSVSGWDTMWTAIGPAVMTVFLIKISGVSLLEASLRKRRPGYEDYMRRTSAFIPWPPRD